MKSAENTDNADSHCTVQVVCIVFTVSENNADNLYNTDKLDKNYP